MSNSGIKHSSSRLDLDEKLFPTVKIGTMTAVENVEDTSISPQVAEAVCGISLRTTTTLYGFLLVSFPSFDDDPDNEAITSVIILYP